MPLQPFTRLLARCQLRAHLRQGGFGRVQDLSQAGGFLLSGPCQLECLACRQFGVAQPRLCRPHLLRQLLHLTGALPAAQVVLLCIPLSWSSRRVPGRCMGLAFPATTTLTQGEPDHRNLAVLPEAMTACSGCRLVGVAAGSLGLAEPGGAKLAKRLAHARLGAVLGRLSAGVLLAQGRGDQWREFSVFKVDFSAVSK